MTRTRLTVLVLLAVTSFAACAFARTNETLEQLIARAQSAPAGDAPALYIKIARLQADDNSTSPATLKPEIKFKRCRDHSEKLPVTRLVVPKETERHRDCPAQDGGVPRRQAQPPGRSSPVQLAIDA